MFAETVDNVKADVANMRTETREELDNQRNSLEKLQAEIREEIAQIWLGLNDLVKWFSKKPFGARDQHRRNRQHEA